MERRKKIADLQTWIAQAVNLLSPISEQPVLEAQVIAAGFLGKSRTWVVSHLKDTLSDSQVAFLDQGVKRLVSGEPLPYILGNWSFYGSDFFVSPAVLIPRPETELLVEKALAWCSRHPDFNRVADVGCGSGCIAISLALHNAQINLTASDISWEALTIARQNIQHHQVEKQVSLVQSNLLSPFGNTFHLVCANLPYIPTATLNSLAVARHEPHLALDGGENGLYWIELLLSNADRFLLPGGALFLEIEADQGISAPQLARRLIPGSEVHCFSDLSGLPRLVFIQT